MQCRRWRRQTGHAPWRRRLRPVGGGVAAARRAGGGRRSGGFLGHRRPQVVERVLRQPHRLRARRRDARRRPVAHGNTSTGAPSLRRRRSLPTSGGRRPPRRGLQGAHRSGLRNVRAAPREAAPPLSEAAVAALRETLAMSLACIWWLEAGGLIPAGYHANVSSSAPPRL